MKTTLRLSAFATLFSLSAAGACLAQTIEEVTVSKTIENVQTSASNVQVNPEPPSPTFGGPYGFSADVDGQNISSISAPVISGPISVAEPAFNGGKLIFNSTDVSNGITGGWRFGFPHANNFGSPTLADNNSLFGSGVYTFAVGGTTVSLDLTGDAYSNDPVLTLSGGVWSGGVYVIDPSQALTITTNAFSGYGTHADDLIRVGVEGIGIASQFHSIVPGTDFLTFTVPAFSLVSGQEYSAGDPASI